jgi:hypothetical protein
MNWRLAWEKAMRKNTRKFFLCFLKIEHLEWLLSSGFSHAIATNAGRGCVPSFKMTPAPQQVERLAVWQ